MRAQRSGRSLDRLLDSTVDDDKCRADKVGVDGAAISSHPEYVGEGQILQTCQERESIFREKRNVGPFRDNRCKKSRPLGATFRHGIVNKTIRTGDYTGNQFVGHEVSCPQVDGHTWSGE